jgi:hypothetical protein
LGQTMIGGFKLIDQKSGPDPVASTLGTTRGRSGSQTNPATRWDPAPLSKRLISGSSQGESPASIGSARLNGCPADASQRPLPQDGSFPL